MYLAECFKPQQVENFQFYGIMIGQDREILADFTRRAEDIQLNVQHVGIVVGHQPVILFYFLLCSFVGCHSTKHDQIAVKKTVEILGSRPLRDAIGIEGVVI